MRSYTRLGALPLAACASLFLFPGITGLSQSATAADVSEDVPIEETDYDYGDADYIPPSPIYAVVRRAITARGLEDGDVSNRNLGAQLSVAAGVDLEQLHDITLTRFEIEVGYLNQSDIAGDGTRFDLSGASGLVSLYRDLGEFYSIRPYLGAGIGIARLDSRQAASSDDTTGIAWHASAGFSIDWSENATIDIGYRYTGVEDLDIQPASGAVGFDRFETHAVFTGLRFRL